MANVLLVEDDELILRLYKKTLEFANYTVFTANNGQSALDQLPSARPEIILLDIMMPNMNGIEFLKNMTAGTGSGQIPVIVLTNVADEAVKIEAVEAGASLVLVKSQIDPDEVVTAVKQVLAGEILQTGESLEGNSDNSSLEQL